MSKENLVLSHVCFSENGNEELNEVNLTVFEGDILGLITLDNQGLESLINLIMNNHLLERGHVLYRGKEVSGCLTCKKTPNKIALVEAQSRLVPALNIADNFFFVKGNCPLFVHRRKQNRQIQRVFSQYGISLLGTEYPSSLSDLERCKVEIIKAGMIGVKVIILRDPSSFLGPKEVASLNALLKQIAENEGVSFIYLCNHHREILSYCSLLAIMYSGTIVLQKNCSAVTEEMMSIVSRDSVRLLPDLHKPIIPPVFEEAVQIKNTHGVEISVGKGECVVLLDLDNKVIPEITDALFEKGAPKGYSITVGGKPAFKNTALWSYIPANPISSSLFYDMSYVDNLILKKGNSKIANFWLRKKYRKTIIAEYCSICGDAIESRDLYGMSYQKLYQLLYQRILLEKPQVLFVVQPFNRMDMYQRIRVLEYISQIQKEGIAVVLLAVSLSDSLRLASRLILMQNHTIVKELPPDEFETAAEYGLITR